MPNRLKIARSTVRFDCSVSPCPTGLPTSSRQWVSVDSARPKTGSTLRAESAEQQRQQRLLRMQAVLRLVPHGRPRAVEHVRRDLLARVGGEAVQNDRVRAREAEQRVVEAVRLQVAEALAPRRLLAEGDPDVGDQDVRAAGGLARVAGQLERG